MQNDQNGKLLELVQNAVNVDASLREQFKIGDRFRFIRDRLHLLLTQTKEHVAALQKKAEEKKATVGENEILVFVHLFNSQGMMLQTWHKMVSPAVFYDHSVNRPIYADKESIEAIIRSKGNKLQHAYLTVAVEKSVVAKSSDAQAKDALGASIIKVKEGSLKFNRLMSFTHNGHDYVVGEYGELVREEENK